MDRVEVGIKPSVETKNNRDAGTSGFIAKLVYSADVKVNWLLAKHRHARINGGINKINVG